MNRNLHMLLVTTKEGIEGYKISDIKASLSETEFKDFEKFISGQIVGEFDGEHLVYKHDFERFLQSRDKKIKNLNP